MGSISSLVKPRLLLSIWSSVESLSVSPQLGSSIRLHGGMAEVCWGCSISDVVAWEWVEAALPSGTPTKLEARSEGEAEGLPGRSR